MLSGVLPSLIDSPPREVCTKVPLDESVLVLSIVPLDESVLVLSIVGGA